MVKAGMWQNPPSGDPGSRSARFRELALALRRRPGAWALAEEGLDMYRTQAALMAARIRGGKHMAFQPPGEFESRSSQDKVYVRFVGPDGCYRDFQQTGRKAPAPGTTRHG